LLVVLAASNMTHMSSTIVLNQGAAIMRIERLVRNLGFALAALVVAVGQQSIFG
jgi:hypothetical protein